MKALVECRIEHASDYATNQFLSMVVAYALKTAKWKKLNVIEILVNVSPKNLQSKCIDVEIEQFLLLVINFKLTFLVFTYLTSMFHFLRRKYPVGHRKRKFQQFKQLSFSARKLKKKSALVLSIKNLLIDPPLIIDCSV